MSAQLSRCVTVYSRHFVASRINAPVVVVAVVFTLDHIVTTQTTMGWTKSLLYLADPADTPGSAPERGVHRPRMCCVSGPRCQSDIHISAYTDVSASRKTHSLNVLTRYLATNTQTDPPGGITGRGRSPIYTIRSLLLLGRIACTEWKDAASCYRRGVVCPCICGHGTQRDNFQGLVFCVLPPQFAAASSGWRV